ncbi:flavodoxin [Parabacteroides pacaensis]|uniref:flavodoxin n=1 Tax=Parabacteroides pacaensis TaxID=2086575 RepID=UPI000D0ED275|nr:flavodoxin [Parabacteroides pacaensis]
MNKTGLFYATGTEKTAAIANKIKNAFGEDTIDIVPVERAWKKDFEKYDYLIVGTSTWFDGELPSYWDEMLPELKELDLRGKKVAIFGLGDQVNYPDNFVDGIGLLAEIFKGVGAELAGFTSTAGYYFNSSKAVKNGRFLGLAIDTEIQPEKTEERIRNWVEELKEQGFGK